jgi:hypothetical protein
MAKRKKKIQPAPRVEATPQTISNLRRDPISELTEAGRLNDHQIRAASEIEAVFNFVTSRLVVKSASLDERRGGSGGGEGNTYLEQAWVQHYKPWSDELSVKLAPAQDDDPWLETTIKIVIDGLRGRQIDRDMAWRNGKALEMLRAALTRYADLAGWITGHPASLRYRRVPQIELRRTTTSQPAQ